MKLLPSIGFTDFSGSAGNVTARKTGDKTYLSTRTKHSKKKTCYQAATRCRFTDTVRGYAGISEEQRQGWITLARNLGSYLTSSGRTSITGHNLFVAINTYRKICGKPQCAEAPSELRPSRYISYNDFWLSPEHILFTGLGQRENSNEVLHLEMYPAQSPAESRCWDRTVLVAICPTTDWGEIDITRAFIEKFGAPLTIGQLVFIKICWLDSECGYIRQYTQIAMPAQEASLVYNAPYMPRAQVTTDQIISISQEYECEHFDYELSPGSKITSNDITADCSRTLTISWEFKHTILSDAFDCGLSYQYSRGTAENNYRVQCIEVLIQNKYDNMVNLSYSSGTISMHFETFGTYHVTSEL
ncbi:MAG: hypothetical protein ABFD50_00250 [Smithella sp.]